jgi:hypothetical protein
MKTYTEKGNVKSVVKDESLVEWRQRNVEVEWQNHEGELSDGE